MENYSEFDSLDPNLYGSQKSGNNTGKIIMYSVIILLIGITIGHTATKFQGPLKMKSKKE